MQLWTANAPPVLTQSDKFLTFRDCRGAGGDCWMAGYHGKEVGKGRVDQTQGFTFSTDETTDIGYESGTAVSPDYTAHASRFTGEISPLSSPSGREIRSAPPTTATA
jgi:hypothetical protein